MTPEQTERYRVLVRELHLVSRAIVGLTREIVEDRSFAAKRTMIIELFDHAASIADALVPLDIARAEQEREYQASRKQQVLDDLAQRQRAAAEQQAAAKERARREAAERLVRELA